MSCLDDLKKRLGYIPGDHAHPARLATDWHERLTEEDLLRLLGAATFAAFEEGQIRSYSAQ